MLLKMALLLCHTKRAYTTVKLKCLYHTNGCHVKSMGNLYTGKMLWFSYGFQLWNDDKEHDNYEPLYTAFSLVYIYGSGSMWAIYAGGGISHVLLSAKYVYNCTHLQRPILLVPYEWAFSMQPTVICTCAAHTVV